MTPEEVLPVVRGKVAEWFSYAILYGTRYEEKFIELPWDCSGHPSAIGRFNLDDFGKLSEFLEEPTGNTEATYISGYGLACTTYEKDLYQLVQEVVYDIKKVDMPPDTDPIDWYEEVFEEVDDFLNSIMDICYEWSCKELYLEGSSAAIESKLESDMRVIEHKTRVYEGRLLVEKHGLNHNKKLHLNTVQWQCFRSKLLSLTKEELERVSLVLHASINITQSLSEGVVPSGEIRVQVRKPKKKKHPKHKAAKT